jgi:integrase
MFYTGARVGEICGIRYSDIEGNNLTIRRTVHHPDNVVTEDTKGTFGDREIPLVPKAWNLINAARQCQQEHGAPDDGYIFSMNEGPVLYTSVTKAFYRYCNMLGIDAKSSHKARKTFVSTMLDGGVSINTVRKIVGHTDERTTLNNYCYDRSTDEEKVRKMAAALG